MSHALHNFEGAVKSVDVKLSVAGGDAGKGAKAQKTEVTIYTLRHGVVSCLFFSLFFSMSERDGEASVFVCSPRSHAHPPLHARNNNNQVRVEDVEASAYASIDVVCDKVRGKLRRLKEKAMQRGRWPGSARPRGAKPLAAELVEEAGAASSSEDEGEYWDGAAAGAAAGEPADPALAVIREKTFVLTRMSAADAAEAADLLGHSFYVYQDVDSGGVRVVYKRSATGYGVIIPTTAAQASS